MKLLRLMVNICRFLGLSWFRISSTRRVQQSWLGFLLTPLVYCFACYCLTFKSISKSTDNFNKMFEAGVLKDVSKILQVFNNSVAFFGVYVGVAVNSRSHHIMLIGLLRAEKRLRLLDSVKAVKAKDDTGKSRAPTNERVVKQAKRALTVGKTRVQVTILAILYIFVYVSKQAFTAWSKNCEGNLTPGPVQWQCILGIQTLRIVVMFSKLLMLAIVDKAWMQLMKIRSVLQRLRLTWTRSPTPVIGPA